MNIKKSFLIMGITSVLWMYHSVDLWAAIRFEETDPNIIYQGSWGNMPDNNASGGSYKNSSDATTPASATFTFTGTGVSWISDAWSDLGIANVYIDGVLSATIDLYNAIGEYQKKVYSKTGLSSGIHTIKIEATGTKNPSSTGILIDIDALEVDYASFQVRTDLNPLSVFPKDAAAGGVIQPYIIDFGTQYDGYRFWCYYNPYPPEASEIVWLVRSNDGVTWTDSGVSNPVFQAPAGFNDAAHPAVFQDGATWYLYADGRDLADNKYKIFYATASQPKGPWTFKNVVISPTATWEGYTVGSARILKDGNTWKMWYDQANPDYSKVGYATASSPGGPWTKYSSNPVFVSGGSGQWDDVAVHHIDVIKDGNLFILLYTGQGGDGRNALGMAASTDGVTWWRDRNNPVVMPGNEQWDNGTLYQGTIRRVDGKLKIWYAGASTTSLSDGQIGLAEETTTVYPALTTTRYEETNLAITYKGSWGNMSDPNASGGSYKNSRDASTPASATLIFTGTGVSWISDVWNDLGKARVYIDGVLDATVDLYSATGKYQQVVYSKSGLASGTHTLKIEVTGTKNLKSKGTWVDIDAFEVDSSSGSSTTRYEETNSAVTYMGSWGNMPDINASGGSYKNSSDANTPASATLTFTGTGVSWISDVWNDLGKARVYIDGVLDATVDLYNATGEYQQMVYSKSGLSSGTHTLKIEVTGTKNASSAGTLVDIDAFEVSN